MEAMLFLIFLAILVPGLVLFGIGCLMGAAVVAALYYAGLWQAAIFIFAVWFIVKLNEPQEELERF